MQMGFELNLQQTQKLIMTPELRQAITVLQLSSLELAEFVQEQILENPALEIETAEDSTEETVAAAKEEKEDNEAFDVDWHEYFQDRDIGYVKQPREEAKEVNYDNFLTKAPTLEEYLLNQLKLSCCNAREKEIAQFIIGNLDRNGYLCISLKEIGEMYSYPMSQVEAVLKLVQSFDPPGVAARDLVECLLLQISEKELELNSLLTSVIKYHLEDVAGGRLLKIAKSLDITPEEVQQLVDYIKTLDPKPGRWFADSEQTTYIVPDVVVEKVEGEYIVIVNDVYTPRLGINPVYRRLLSADTVDVNAKKFIEGKLNSAAWIIKSIEQRRLTLYRVVNCIVEFQKSFLEKGVKHLKPLNLKQIAEQLEIHESTVSRATNNKYIQTPQGVFPLKFFFASGVDNYSGSGVSSESIKKMLKEFVSNENSAKPYTDQQLTNMLKAQGIKISRRTVAKYRCELGMASTSRRKRY
ncbi:RNA polymerase factor sigma-54 [Desulfitibacter alkalitolerans]|uniref:RNA polymerase factor sigma-54 n=1 Tax=Desulfitibacter alkalitolerans TaxID=264641 RepID=UPI00048235B3|nr:RNA polymerase factor sigma-54 [Desulfitibacter alkalitolerans]